MVRWLKCKYFARIFQKKGGTIYCQKCCGNLFLKKKGWSCGVNVATALVSTVLTDRINIFISIIPFGLFGTDCGQKYLHDDGGHFVYQKQMPVIKHIFCTIWIAQINWNFLKLQKLFNNFTKIDKMKKTSYLNILWCTRGPVELCALLLELMHTDFYLHMPRKWSPNVQNFLIKFIKWFNFVNMSFLLIANQTFSMGFKSGDCAANPAVGCCC